MYRYALAKAIPKEVEDKVLTLSGEEAGLATSFVLFPKVGFLFRREEAKYQPPKFLHGGVSMQETIVPMAHLVKKREEGDLDVTVEREATYKAGTTGKMTLHLTPRRLFLNLIFDITLPDGTQTQQPLFLTAGKATHEISFDVPALPEGEEAKSFYLKIVGRDVETRKEMARLVEPVDVVKPEETPTVCREATNLMDNMFKKKGR